jgi:hypothetical protein
MEPRIESTHLHRGMRFWFCVSDLCPHGGVPALHWVQTRDCRWLQGVWLHGLLSCAKALSTLENRALGTAA